MRHEPYEKRRLLYVGPVGFGVVSAAASIPWLVVSLLSDGTDAATLLLGPLVGFGGGVVIAWLFNIVAPMIGGLQVWLTKEAVVAPDEARWKPCPACSSRVVLDRSFCPQCGHDFDGSDDDE